MFELTFLGTAASTPLPKRGLSSALVTHGEHRFMVDCGEGTQRQLLTSGLGFRRLEHILLTHPHLDHILGLGGILSTLSQWETISGVTLYGGKATLDKVEDLIYQIVFRGGRPPLRIDMVELYAGMFLEGDDFSVSAFPVRHRGPDCYGFVFEEMARRPFLNDKATALGVPPGPERRALVHGTPITLTDGRVIHPDEVLGELRTGARLVMTGDVGDTQSILPVVTGASTLVTEATYSDTDGDMARDHGHLSAGQAARLARDAGVGQLILTHISGRHRERDLEEEARAIFPNTVLARDFDAFKIKGEVTTQA
jgi:ribonuclease Z